MTRKETKRLLEAGVIQAFAEGKTIQIRMKADEWKDLPEPVTFEDFPENYRIKPEPRHFWIGAILNEPFTPLHGLQITYPTKELADQRVTGGSAACTEVIEVIK